MSAAERYIAMMTAPPVYDETGDFVGLTGSGCGEHRTVGSYRAWCYSCAEWCYPRAPCARCGPTLEGDLPRILAEHEREVREQVIAELRQQIAATCARYGGCL